MQWIKRLTLILFVLILLVPMVLFDFREGVVSEIDNRPLAENPLLSLEEGNLHKRLQEYVNDRIGLRDEMILGYTVLNDRLFGKMVHPSYIYGKDGYVFGAGRDRITFSDYHVQFANMILQLQEYCRERGIVFVMAFDPAKPAVLQSYLPEGYNYNRDWVDELFAPLDEYGVNYVDNTQLLTELQSQGTVVFNQKYDANHWNSLGAWYGVNNILKRLQQELPNTHLTGQEELVISQKLQTSLPVSQFPIYEYVPDIKVQNETENRTAAYDAEVVRDSQYRAFGYYYNEARALEGAPRALVFQGSYMNSSNANGYQYFANAFSEYVYVHDYANILNLQYYINIFQPECVIFEVAEYTINNTYFNYSAMKELDLNSALPKDRDWSTVPAQQMEEGQLLVEEGNSLTVLTWVTEEHDGHAWLLCGDAVYDWIPCEGGYTLTLHKQAYAENADSLTILVQTADGQWKRILS